jgi:translation initiation factor IF-2
MGLGTIANINAELSSEMAELLAVELGVEVDVQREVALEDKLLQGLGQEDDPATLQPRPPIVTFLGHVDHGKTSLLDRIIGIDVVSSEKGGITQHIRAYRVEKDGRAVAFVDTPGHEAFTEMRARGANVTDIAVLVVAADDGVMPQTEEAISHARAAGVPIVVALNKIDLPGLNIDRVMQQLATNELLPSEWGGETELVRTSAATGVGMDELLETLLTVAELHEYRANPGRPARGTCLEAQLHEGRGVVAKLLVQNGTLRVGDVVVCGPAYGRVKAMYDTLSPRKRYDEAGPSTPVDVTGLHVAPGAGDRFYVLDDISAARQLAESRAAQSRRRELTGGQPHVTLETLYQRLGEQSDVQTLNIILRADVRGSIEAIRKELTKLEHPEVQIKILQATVGGITEADVHLADASDAIIIGFTVVPDEGARALADRLGVQIRRYDIIYQVTDDLKAALQGMLKPEQREKELGRALVQRVFHISRIGSVAGCRVLAGTIHRDARARVIRESRVIGDYSIDTLKREKDDAREVREGMECGMKLAGFNDIKEGDVLEAYKIEEIARTL